MADQDFIRKQVQQLADKISDAQEEIVGAIMELTSGKSNAEAVKIINDLDIDSIVKLKTSGVLSAYTTAQTDMLLSKQFFGDISEDDLRALLIASEQYLGANVTSMGGVIRRQVLNGISNNKPAADILEVVGKQGYGTVGLSRIIRDGMNNYSRVVSSFMIDEAPENTKYVYIGPADEKTREYCLNLMAAGSITIKQLRENGWTQSLTEGGGTNCRHNWEIASSNVRDQFHRGEEAQEILDA